MMAGGGKKERLRNSGRNQGIKGGSRGDLQEPQPPFLRRLDNSWSTDRGSSSPGHRCRGSEHCQPIVYNWLLSKAAGHPVASEEVGREADTGLLRSGGGGIEVSKGSKAAGLCSGRGLLMTREFVSGASQLGRRVKGRRLPFAVAEAELILCPAARLLLLKCLRERNEIVFLGLCDLLLR